MVVDVFKSSLVLDRFLFEAKKKGLFDRLVGSSDLHLRKE